MKTKATKITGILLTLVMLATMLGAFSLTVGAADPLTVTIDTGASVTLQDTDNDGYYEIKDANDLYAFAAAVNGGSTSINGELTADIIVNTNVLVDGALNTDTAIVAAFRAWTPIGNYNSPYIGKFDGQEYTVKGLYCVTVGSVDACAGLFGRVGEGDIRSRTSASPTVIFTPKMECRTPVASREKTMAPWITVSTQVQLAPKDVMMQRPVVSWEKTAAP